MNTIRRDATPGARSMKLTPGRRRTLGARAREHSEEDLVRVWRWAFTSDHSRARFLREGGYANPDTLHRASNFASYADMARDWADTERDRPSSGSALDDFLDDDPTGDPT